MARIPVIRLLGTATTGGTTVTGSGALASQAEAVAAKAAFEIVEIIASEEETK